MSEMAYAALISLVQTVDRILNHEQSYPFSLAEYQDIKSIRDYAIFLQEYLEVSPKKTIIFDGRITEVTHKAEDTIECLMLENNRSDCRSIESTLGPSKAKFKRQLRKVAEEMKSIVGEIKDSFTIEDVPLSEPPAAAGSSSELAPTGTNDMVGFDDFRTQIMDGLFRQQSTLRKVAAAAVGGLSFVPPTGTNYMVGFDDDRDRIMALLLYGEESDLHIIPIVGTGGTGKTTLARNIYDHPRTRIHFDVRAWVTVSQHYNVEEILSSILVSTGVPRENIPGQSNESMGEKVYKTLCRRRYLIVLDDVWNGECWDHIKENLPNDKNGSRIMLTTRQSRVASYLYSGYVQWMRLMDDDESWDLLRHKVFGYETCPHELQEIGKEIARSCGGLPLSIVGTAEILSTIDRTRASWEAIAHSVISAVATKDGQFEMMMSSSYTHLPHHLRLCLLYMGGFPKDHEIRAAELIKLWVAEGFVEPNGSRSYEEEAEMYLQGLVREGLVLVTSRKFDGRIKSCCLHNVVRDFCVRKVEEEKILLPVMDYLPSSTLRRYFLPQILKNQRRVVVTSYDLNLKETLYNSPIRTIICISQRWYSSKGSVQNFPLLRVLHALNENYELNWEPDHVFELIHLRYLASNITFIPPTISKLQNLQTLIIYRSEVRLPVEIWRLPRLRHLIAFSFHPLPNPELTTSPLESLHTLSLATNFVCSQRILELIPNLKKFGICNYEERFDADYHLDNLRHLRQLSELKLEIHRAFPLGRNLNLAFPWFLQKLTLSGCRLPWKDMRVVSSLPFLQVLKLRDLAFQGEVWETIEGDFCSLKYLLIDESDLQYWLSEKTHFLCLERLLLYRCPYLREIPDEIGETLALQLIEVDDQNEYLVDSAKRIKEKKRDSGSYLFQVQVKHS